MGGGRGHWLEGQGQGQWPEYKGQGLKDKLGQGAGTWRQGPDPDLRARAREQEPGGTAQGPEGKDQGIEVWEVLGWLVSVILRSQILGRQPQDPQLLKLHT